MAFTVIVVGDPVLASVAMGNWRNVNYGNALLPVDATGNGVNNTIAAGSSSYRFSNTYSVLGNFSGQITSTLTTGTAPFSIASTTKVANLNADFLDDQTGSYYQNSDNQSAGTLPSGRLAGAYTGITGVGSLTVSGNAVINGTALGWDASLNPFVQVGNTLALIGVAGSTRIYNNLYYDGATRYASGTTIFGSVWSFDTSTGTLAYANTSSTGNAADITPTLANRFTITKTGKITQEALSAGGEIFLQSITGDTGIFNRFYNNSNTGSAVYGLENSVGSSTFSQSDPYAFCAQVPSGRAFNWIIDTTRVLKINSTGMAFDGATVTGKINLPNHTTAAGGLYIGSDVTLYRSAADTLKTDDSLVVTGTLNSGQLTVTGDIKASLSVVKSVQNAALLNSTYEALGLPDTQAGGIFTVACFLASNAQVATTKVIAISTRLGANGQTTLHTQNGPSGSVSYTVTIGSDNALVVTNTHGATLSVYLHFSGFNG